MILLTIRILTDSACDIPLNTDLSNVEITVSKDHEEAKEIENNTKFTEEGTYKITATDEDNCL